MRLSVDWLKEFIEVKESPNELAELLTGIGIEAEVTTQHTEIPGVVIGLVETAIKHPDADKLKLCTVNDGQNIHQIVCGAPNVDKGQKIALATVGSVLPGNLKIKKANIRGVESSGMICSERELHISDEHEGIMILPDDLKLGDEFLSAYGFRFQSLELDITPNRPDAFSHQGVARDIACKTGRAFTPVSVKPSDHNKKDIKISIEDKKDCPRYIAAIMENVKVGKSPDWLVDRLKAIGQRSVNNIVDISNFVLMEMGHPTHIFDYHKINGDSILVRRAKKDETLKTLDDAKHQLDETHLLITDGNKPIALAGIMGGIETSVTEGTNTILIESAYFDPVAIRKAAKSLAMSTDASKRYERGADPNGCITAFWRVVNLLEKLTGGNLLSGPTDHYPLKIEERIITMRRSELDLIIGISIESETVDSILTGLEISFKYKNDSWECVIPTFRPDITREIDLIEEIVRMYGYDKIPSDEKIYGSYNYENPDPEKFLDPVRYTLVGCGFNQIYANSLQSEKEAKLSGNKPVTMVNPLNLEMGSLRTSLLPGLLKAADYNLKHGSKDLRLFELAHIHIKNGEGLENISEKKYLSGLILGNKTETSVHSKEENENIFTLKGYLTTLFEKKLKMRFDLLQSDIPGFELSRQIMLNRQKVGGMGRLSKNWINILELDLDDVFGFEINLEPILGMMKSKRTFKNISHYPKISRDLNLVMPAEQEVGDLVDLFFRLGKKIIVEAKPVNIFVDEKNIGKDKKSVTYAITFQDSSKTLEDNYVNEVINEIIVSAEKKYFAKLRS